MQEVYTLTALAHAMYVQLLYRHVETVVLLSQQKPDDTIEIDLDLDELDATSAETKATYQEIKDYVLKEFGLKVSNLYISQIKRKCGIEVGENYNLPKTENHLAQLWIAAGLISWIMSIVFAKRTT